MPDLVAEIEVRTPFLPLFEHPTRFTVVVAHRRAGKTVAAIQRLLHAALSASDKPDARYLFVAPFRSQAKEVAWDYLLRMSADIPGREVNLSELRVDLPNGARIRLAGADNPDALRGTYLDGVVLDEVAQMDPRAWGEVLRPQLADRKGWAVFIGTPLGQNDFHRLYTLAGTEPGWSRLLLRASTTGLIDAEELDAARRAMSEEQYAQEFECSWTAAIPGAYYGRLIERAEQDGRIGGVPWDSHAKTYTAWDLGIGDSTAIWVLQTVGKEVHVIDHYEAESQPLSHYAQWLKAQPYVYEQHILPHDAAARELQSGKSRVEALLSLGIRATVLPQHRVEDGIEAVRNLLPRCWFDAKKTARGLDCLRNYRAGYDPRGRTLRTAPVHDWTSHSADAFRQFAMHRLPDAKRMGPIPYKKLNVI
jgi:hypothetical protein